MVSLREILRGIGSAFWSQRAYLVATLTAAGAVLVAINLLRAVEVGTADTRLLLAVVVGFVVFSWVENRLED